MSIYSILQEIDCASLQLSSTRVYLNRLDTPEVRDDSCLPEQNKPTHLRPTTFFYLQQNYKATTLDLQLVPASTTDKANRLDRRCLLVGSNNTKRVPRYDLQQRDATLKHKSTTSGSCLLQMTSLTAGSRGHSVKCSEGSPAPRTTRMRGGFSGNSNSTTSYGGVTGPYHNETTWRTLRWHQQEQASCLRQ
jgi:hypothetical protein